MARKVRVFFDSNVIFSGIYGKTGAPASLLDLCADGKIEMAISSQVLEETVRAVGTKRPEALTALQSFMSSVLPIVVDDPTDEEVQDALALVGHEDDAPILAAALKAEVDFLVTGNAGNFRSAHESSMQVVSPAELVKQ